MEFISLGLLVIRLIETIGIWGQISHRQMCPDLADSTVNRY